MQRGGQHLAKDFCRVRSCLVKAGAKQHLGQSKHLASAENDGLNVKCSLHLQDQDTLHRHFLCEQKY